MNSTIEHAQFLRIKKLKGSGIITVAARHNLREIQSEIGADSHIDTTKTHLNVILQGCGRAADVAAEAVKLMDQAKLSPLRKDAVRGLEIIFSLPPMSGIAELDFFTNATAWAGDFFEIPILSALIHNDEAAPHCHVILLPLLDRRMIGSGLIGNKARLIAMQADFHAKIGQRYGLKRGTTAKRYSRVAMAAAAAHQVVSALQRDKNSLDDPAIRDALRDALGETISVHLMELLGLDAPEVRTPKPRTFASIMTRPCKPVNPIGFQGKNPIGFTTASSVPKDQSLSCVGFANSAVYVAPEMRGVEVIPFAANTCDDYRKATQGW